MKQSSTSKYLEREDATKDIKIGAINKHTSEKVFKNQKRSIDQSPSPLKDGDGAL